MTANYAVNDCVIIQNGTTFILGKIEAILPTLSHMGRANYDITTGCDIRGRKKVFEVGEEMIVCKEENMITCDI